LRWRREGGHKRGRMRGGERILGLAFGFGLVVVLEDLFESKVGKREGEYCLSWTHYI